MQHEILHCCCRHRVRAICFVSLALWISALHIPAHHELQSVYVSQLLFNASCLSSRRIHTVLRGAIMPEVCCRWDQGFGSDAKAGAGIKCAITAG